MLKWIYNLLTTADTRAFIKKYGYEWLLTLSNKDSFFSSKRIERFLFINVGLVLTILYCKHRWDSMNAYEFIAVISPLFVYAGFNTKQIYKDVNGEPSTTETTERVETTQASQTTTTDKK